MFDEISSLENLFAAWRTFRRGKRGKSDVQLFERHIEDELFSLHHELHQGTYRHGPYERFSIFDPKYRVIHKAKVRDRVVHHAVYRVLAPVLDRSFIFDSYSCRKEKGTHAAVDRLTQFTRRVSHNFQGPCWALKCDIAKFFNNINHDILLGMLGRWIPDIRTMGLVREIIQSYGVGNEERERVKGIPLGNLTSQLFANVYLNALDHKVKEVLQVRFYLRYTDDFIILHDNPVQLVAILPVLRSFLRDQLTLELHPQKIILQKLRQGIDFLGYVVRPHYRVLRTKTKQRMMKKMRERVEEFNKGIANAYSLQQSMQSYLGMLSHCAGYRLGQHVRNIALVPAQDILH